MYFRLAENSCQEWTTLSTNNIVTIYSNTAKRDLALGKKKLKNNEKEGDLY
jgi:hypothetical protein